MKDLMNDKEEIWNVMNMIKSKAKQNKNGF